MVGQPAVQLWMVRTILRGAPCLAEMGRSARASNAECDCDRDWARGDSADCRVSGAVVRGRESGLAPGGLAAHDRGRRADPDRDLDGGRHAVVAAFRVSSLFLFRRRAVDLADRRTDRPGSHANGRGGGDGN